MNISSLEKFSLPTPQPSPPPPSFDYQSPSPMSLGLSTSPISLAPQHFLIDSYSIQSSPYGFVIKAIWIYLYAWKDQEPWPLVLFLIPTAVPSTKQKHLKEWVHLNICLPTAGTGMGKVNMHGLSLIPFYSITLRAQ